MDINDLPEMTPLVVVELPPVDVEHIEDIPKEIVVEEKVIPVKALPSTNVVQDSEVFTPLDPKVDDDSIILRIPGDTDKNINLALDAMPNVDITDTERGSEWVNNIKAAKYSVSKNGWFGATVARPDSMFNQTVKSERGNLGAGVPKFNDSAEGKLTGARAVLQVRGLMGLGSIVKVPLWHSGFWITFKAPSEGEMLELHRRFAEEKISLGRETFGLAFANNSVFFAGWLMDFALNHIYATTLKAEIQESIRERISSLDIPIIAWGLACVIWPRGFPYARAVMDQSGEQNKIIREKLNLGKCQWTDNNALTAWQIGHMAGSHGGIMTAESLERYRNEFTRGKGRTVTLSEGLEITFRVPNLEQYLTSGQKWVNNIVTMVDRAFGLPPQDNVRDKYIIDQGKATNMRQFTHWVESMSINGNIIDDVETLEQAFDALTAKDGIRETYFTSVRSFVEDSTISIIAIPATENTDVAPLPRFPHLLPLDAMSVFFILLVQKVQIIQDRA